MHKTSTSVFLLKGLIKTPGTFDFYESVIHIVFRQEMELVGGPNIMHSSQCRCQNRNILIVMSLWMWAKLGQSLGLSLYKYKVAKFSGGNSKQQNY